MGFRCEMARVMFFIFYILKHYMPVSTRRFPQQALQGLLGKAVVKCWWLLDSPHPPKKSPCSSDSGAACLCLQSPFCFSVLSSPSKADMAEPHAAIHCGLCSATKLQHFIARLERRAESLVSLMLCWPLLALIFPVWKIGDFEQCWFSRWLLCYAFLSLVPHFGIREEISMFIGYWLWSDCVAVI